MTKICFCAIFRNESANVYRCLDAVKTIITSVSICDTGSEDNTIMLIEKWGKENDIPTKVHQEPFKNFSYNRSLSFRLAKESFPDEEYCLLIDADMVLVIEDKLPDKLDKEQYSILQKNGNLDYWNTRLINMKYNWICVGATHEYWDISDHEYTKNKLLGLWIDDKDDGGHKEDKHERDVKLLTEEIDDPDTEDYLKGRDMFYLAETYRHMGKYDKSIEWHNKRIEHGGWSEEIFYSKYRLGTLYDKKKEYDIAAGKYLDAWNYRPSRAEPLYHLAKMYRKLDKKYSKLCYTFAKMAQSICYPKKDTLFIQSAVYSYLPAFEISICAYYIDEKEEGLQACAKMISMKDKIPEYLLNRVKKNMSFYI